MTDEPALEGNRRGRNVIELAACIYGGAGTPISPFLKSARRTVIQKVSTIREGRLLPIITASLA